MKATIQPLTEFEIQQSGVQKILAYIEGRLHNLRVMNDSMENDSTFTRGRIIEIKSFQRLLNNMEK